MSNTSIRDKSQKTILKPEYIKLISVIPWVLFCIILSVIVIKFRLVGYETNDDFYFALITSGFYGSHDYHTVFNNVILSVVFTQLQRLLPGHNWTTLGYLFMIFSSYAVLGVCNIWKNKPLKGYISSLILVFSTYNSLICKMNFSKTGALVFATGLLLLALSVDSDNWRNKINLALRIVSYIFICLGSFIRKDVIFSALPIFAIIILYIFLSSTKDKWKKMIPFIGVLSAVALLWVVNSLVYSSDSEWKNNINYNSARSKLLDYGMSPYYFNEEEYAAMGISENDYYMLGSWQYADEDFYTIEKIEKLTEIRDENVKADRLTDYINQLDIFAHSRENYLFIIYVLLFVFFITANISSEKTFLYQLSIIGLCMLEIVYLVINRRLNERGIYVPIITTLISLLFFLSKERASISKKRHINIAIQLSIVMLFTFFSSGIYNPRIENNSFTKNATGSCDLLEYTSTHSDNLYIMDIFSNMNMLADVYAPLDSIEKDLHANIALTGGWMVPSPIMNDIAREYGDPKNLFEILATNEKSYWISPSEEINNMVLIYINEHYNPEAEITLIETIGSYSIYSFTQ